MIALVGFAGILVALCSAGLLCAMGVRALRRPAAVGRTTLQPLVLGMLGGAATAFLALEAAILTNDFSIKYVAEHHARSTPFLFKLATAWAALEGSIVLWGLVLGGYTWFVFRQFRNGDRLGAGTLAVMGAVGVFFFGVLATVANPFKVLAVVPPDGPGPNPLLQNHILMAVHPPLLYLGYVGFTVPFAFAISALVLGEPGTGWVRRTQRWSLVAWMFLTAGITCGAWWSYAVLGWGGYWAWDPVENASFLPWLVGTAYIHSAVIQARRGMLQAWSVALVICTFALTILGTFLTRSGVIASVHSFTQSAIGPTLLGFLVVVLIGSFTLFAYRAQLVASSPKLESLASREGSFLLNNLLLTLFAFTVLTGTLYPILVEAFTGDQVSVGRPFFDRMAIPLSLSLLLAMGLGPILPYRAARPRVVWDRMRWPLRSGLAVGTLSVLLGLRQPYVLFVLVIGTAIAASTVRQLLVAGRSVRSVIQGDPSYWGGQLAHLGFVIIAVGIAVAGNMATRATVELDQNKPVAVAGYQLVYRSVADHDESNRSVRVARVELRRDGHVERVLTPRLSQFANTVQAVGTPAVYTTPAGDDIYLSIIRLEDGHLTGHFFRYPKIGLLWLGGFVAAGGALFSLAVRKRRRRMDPSAEPVLAVDLRGGTRKSTAKTKGEGVGREVIRRWGMAVVTVAMALVVLWGMVSGAQHTPDRARQLASRLRCPVCQAESVADSPSETAQQMNQLIGEQVRDGRSDGEILGFFRQRYGDWILLDPPRRGRTIWVWVLPAAALVLGVAVVLGRSGRRAAPVELTPGERSRVRTAVAAAVTEDDE